MMWPDVGMYVIDVYYLREGEGAVCLVQSSYSA